MGISYVNGFLCLCPCDVAKAKQGKDPHPNLHANPDAAQAKKAGQTQNAADAKRAAVIFSGSLAQTTASDSVAAIALTPAADATTTQPQGSLVDLLA
jgi:hypothetical protein